MVLDADEIRKRIEGNAHRKEIRVAVDYQDRLRFHASIQTAEQLRGNSAYNDFLTFVRNMLPSDKYRRFLTQLRTPVATTRVTAKVFNRLARIFDGTDPVFDYQFSDSALRDDWDWYSKDILREPDVWEKDGWDHFKTDINSILVCDIPEEPVKGDPYPQPYFYWLPFSSVVGYEMKDKRSFEWLAFRQKGGDIVVVDDSSYRIFAEKDGNVGEMKREAVHGLGYCPARFFWETAVSLSMPEVKEHPLIPQLSSLDWYLFYLTAKQNLDLYAGYPILSGYEQTCDYQSPSGEVCDHGFLRDEKGFYETDANGAMVECPKCGKNRIVGPGTFVTIPVPKGEDDMPDMRDPVQMLSVDRPSLDYGVEEIKRLEKEIIEGATGCTNNETREAINEKQVEANFESQNNVLKRIKVGFESARQFVDETICRLRYGNGFISCQIDYGTDFLTQTADSLRERYSKAKADGASEAELDSLLGKTVYAEYRNNPTAIQRMEMLSHLEPYRHLSVSELLTLYDKGLVSEADMLLKIGFSDFVKRFERENINILEFGSQMDFDKRIETILNELKRYAKERHESGTAVQVSGRGRGLLAHSDVSEVEVQPGDGGGSGENEPPQGEGQDISQVPADMDTARV